MTNLEDLRAMVLEQGLALEGLQPAVADAEECRRSNYAENLKMIAQMGSSEHSDVGVGSREGEGVSAENNPSAEKGAEAGLVLLEYAGDMPAF